MKMEKKLSKLENALMHGDMKHEKPMMKHEKTMMGKTNKPMMKKPKKKSK